MHLYVCVFVCLAARCVCKPKRAGVIHSAIADNYL
ncbi:hypothetical protein NP493_1518g00007 [Ridgeia piscesae]|uniref:Uncharacterized protein n=1 Tax=Ridgeia piscesae TaxID=27915 RepID=A0AAD9NBJ1_RIDPI|nr:hypothetical protein NP493_1518g00007 [Ridgeia piscesae]